VAPTDSRHPLLPSKDVLPEPRVVMGTISVTGYYITSMLRATVPQAFQVYGRQTYPRQVSSILLDWPFARARGRVPARTVIG
jgi:hypothetical protein